MSRKKQSQSRSAFSSAARHALVSAAAFAAIVAASAPWARAGSDVILLQTYPDHSRLAIRIDESVPIDWKNTPSGFEITLKGIGLADLGAPLGEETRWSAQFDRVADPRLGHLVFREVPGATKIVGKWIYPTGKAQLADQRMEAFEFREKTPARFVIDFWAKRGPTVAQLKVARHRAELAALEKKAHDEQEKRQSRRLATERAKSQALDPSNFCQQPLSDSSDVFLPFLPIHEKVNFGRWIPTTTPDSKFSYYRPRNKTREAQYVRLALKLYRDSDLALTTRTLDFLDQEFPNSVYRHEMRFLRANALLKLNLNVDAEKILGELMTEAQGSPVALQAGMF
ncbi:MAG: hypothetical protein ACXWOH_10120, partial [Bdellovibrionota bacterium]